MSGGTAVEPTREWIIGAGHRLVVASAALLSRVEIYLAELCRAFDIEPPVLPRFDAEYFRQRMAEARERRDRERYRRAADLQARRSDPLEFDDPLQLEAIPGLAAALDAFVGGPLPVELLRRFAARPEFDLRRYEEHVLAWAKTAKRDFADVPPLIDNPRLDRIFRFIAVIFLAHRGLLEVFQDRERIWVVKHETDGQRETVATLQSDHPALARRRVAVA